MNRYLADLHIHTCLSPCGSLDMSPSVIVRTALERGLHAIAITDHNSTLQCPEIQALGAEYGLTVFAGVEVTTREEAHCLVFFEKDETRQLFQQYLDDHLVQIPNKPERFGDQVWVNRKDEIQGEIPWLLLSALDQSINQISSYAKQLGCLFVAAHVERPSYSLISQLGFIDPTLSLDGIEYNNIHLFQRISGQHPYLSNYLCYPASDAHYPDQIGSKPAVWQTSTLSFEGLRKTFLREPGYLLFSSA